mmetsp:Transcript_14982/g.28629  ORF Transcript_14982/g.28629 Transcript_14982/m.28629 type:complete len:87 (+) Transcript_14982:103-363(+)|eukprot:scaffold360_cov192-Amphora_coffeaeformis.AAC.1
MSSPAKYEESGKKYDEEPDIVAEAIPAPGGGGGNNEAPIPAGHSRFYCSKCHTPYDLPQGATSWRCANCMEFNSTTMGECPWCTIL